MLKIYEIKIFPNSIIGLEKVLIILVSFTERKLNQVRDYHLKSQTQIVPFY